MYFTTASARVEKRLKLEKWPKSDLCMDIPKCRFHFQSDRKLDEQFIPFHVQLYIKKSI